MTTPFNLPPANNKALQDMMKMMQQTAAKPPEAAPATPPTTIAASTTMPQTGPALIPASDVMATMNQMNITFVSTASTPSATATESITPPSPGPAPEAVPLPRPFVTISENGLNKIKLGNPLNPSITIDVPKRATANGNNITITRPGMPAVNIAVAGGTRATLIADLKQNLNLSDAEATSLADYIYQRTPHLRTAHNVNYDDVKNQATPYPAAAPTPGPPAVEPPTCTVDPPPPIAPPSCEPPTTGTPQTPPPQEPQPTPPTPTPQTPPKPPVVPPDPTPTPRP